jgi:hypothetical protein
VNHSKFTSGHISRGAAHGQPGEANRSRLGVHGRVAGFRAGHSVATVGRQMRTRKGWQSTPASWGIGNEHFLPRRKMKGSIEIGKSPVAQAAGVRIRGTSEDSSSARRDDAKFGQARESYPLGQCRSDQSKTGTAHAACRR